MIGNRELLFSAAPPQETVHVRRLAADFIVRGMGGNDRDRWEVEIERQRSSSGGVTNWRGSVLVRCLFNEDGSRMFADTDADALGAIDSRVLDRLYAAAARLSGLSAADMRELGNASA